MRRPRALLIPIVLTVALVGAAGCGVGDDAGSTAADDTRSPTTTAGATTVAPTTAPSSPPSTGSGSRPTTTTTAPARLGPESRLRLDGLGPVRVGMTLDEARRVAGVTLEASENEHCRVLRSTAAGFPVHLIAEGGERVNLVIVSEGPIRTVSGIAVGSTEAQVKAAYPGQIEIRPGAPGPHRIVYRPRDPGLASFSLVFQIDASGRVQAMKAGLRAQTEADENCA